MKNIFLIIITISLALFGCKKKIKLDLNTEENKRLIVDAQFSTFAQEHEVKLQLSSNYYSTDQSVLVSGATVSVSDGTNTFVYSETSPGVYKTLPTAAAIPEKEYTLTINYNGKTYTAKDYCDEAPILDTVLTEIIYEDNNTDIAGVELKISTQEKAGGRDFYAWKIYVNGELRNGEVSEQIAIDGDNYPDGVYFNERTITFIDEVNAGDTIKVAQHAISKFTYESIQAILFQTEFRGGIFDSPPANVPTNMSEGAMGIFTVSGEKRNYTVIQ